MKDVLIGIDAGTSVIKAVAFTLEGKQMAVSSIANQYHSLDNAGVEQNMHQTWQSTVTTLLGLQEEIPDLAARVAAVAVTGQGDGTWLMDADGEPVGDAWLWLDGRAGSIVDHIRGSERDAVRFNETGTGLAACQQGAQLNWMAQHTPDVLAKSQVACHCKDWLYYKLTGQQVSDPSESTFTFGNFRTRQYSDTVIEQLGLTPYRRLLPPIVDGVEHSDALSSDAANITGLLAGTPVILGYVDVICTALGAGLYDPKQSVGCTIVGSTGMHMQLARSAADVPLNEEHTGFVMPMPVPDTYAVMQSNMASTLNIDWLLDVATQLLAEFGTRVERADLVDRIEGWMQQASAGSVLYQPYISESGERGPIIESAARAGFVGLTSTHRFPDLVLAVIEGLAFAARDCYTAMGDIPEEIRLSGGAARSTSLRSVFASILGATLRTSEREEAGAAGAAMMAAVCIGHYSSMDDCVAQWVDPLLGDAESADAVSVEQYQRLFPHYVAAREALRPLWRQHAETRRTIQ